MSYEIADEPIPSGTFGNLAFAPSGPLLASMMCGAWLAFPWFIVNSLALGSPTQRREIQLSVITVAVTVLLGFTIYALVDAGVIESTIALQIALLVVTGWKLGMAYLISTIQTRTFHVYSYYGGIAHNAWPVVFIGMQVRWLVVGASDNPIWRVIVSGVL